ncbi:DDE-domain-containing protein [Pleomassaria siparia CBS 279.74]|uniref:DDE-domain-containing protein n=1 Tax=Pleomassaria siparia CBS 279.74 TaxID=1314801 RepID=A0A6G1K5C9_9PLEO|nr:DDE-domain-containing protein [Pleomassaria siparia CBS 279.74]
MLSSVKVLVGKDNKRKHRGTRVKRTTVTAVECISADGSNWTTFPTPGWHYACNESGYTDLSISLQWLKRVFDPETKERANGRPRVLILDGFGTHETLEILEYCFANNIILCRLPLHTPLKTAYRE